MQFEIMASKITWTFLFAIAALQLSLAAPPINKWQLQFEVSNELFQMVTDAMEQLRKVFQLVIDEAELILPPDSNGNILKELKEFVAALDTLDFDDSFELNRLEDALEELESIISIAGSKEFESEADEVVVQLFIQHGVEDLEHILEKNLETTLKSVEQKVEKYMSTWSDSRLARNSDLVKQFNEFKNEKDVYEKLDKLSNSDFI
ncbi:uncharacterized protein LOC120445742 [Drosophila santomea]|uniref:uncharacterized protein LOC120445742 n=1 Tax=Drosophila santomea TaxID=129105 RepID=UPI0019546DC8|nr:uncharacterized protein LOC120445742 [Drosophila santomea]